MRTSCNFICPDGCQQSKLGAYLRASTTMDLRVDVHDARGGKAAHYLVHKRVLCALSGFFRKRIRSREESNQSHQSIQVQADPDVFGVFLALVYDGRATVAAHEAVATEKALKMFEIDFVRERHTTHTTHTTRRSLSAPSARSLTSNDTADGVAPTCELVFLAGPEAYRPIRLRDDVDPKKKKKTVTFSSPLPPDESSGNHLLPEGNSGFQESIVGGHPPPQKFVEGHGLLEKSARSPRLSPKKVGGPRPPQKSVGGHRPPQKSLGGHRPLPKILGGHRPLPKKVEGPLSSSKIVGARRPTQESVGGHRPPQKSVGGHRPPQKSVGGYRPPQKSVGGHRLLEKNARGPCLSPKKVGGPRPSSNSVAGPRLPPKNLGGFEANKCDGPELLEYMILHDIEKLIDYCDYGQYFTCVVCGKLYKSKQSILRHIRAIHQRKNRIED